MAEAPPTTVQAADILGNFLAPLKPLVAFHEALSAQGGLETAASEAQSRAAAAQRDLDEAQKRLEVVEADIVARQGTADQTVRNAAQQALEKLQAAQAEAERLVAEARTNAEALIAEAQVRADGIAAQTVAAERILSETEAKVQTANNALAEAQAQLDALKARLG